MSVAVATEELTDAGTSTLGYVVWFSISNGSTRDPLTGKRSAIPVNVSADDLTRWFEELDLDKAYLPVPISQVNAFRAASSRISAEYDLPVDGQRARLTVKEVRQDTEQIVRHVIREVVDSRRQKLSADRVAELRFNRGRRSARGRVPHTASVLPPIVRHGLDDLDRAQVQDQLAQFQDRYGRLATFRDDDDVRTLLREYLRGIGAIVVEPGKGIYFVWPEQREVVDRLAALVSLVGDRCTMRCIPLLDDRSQRDMLAESYDEQVEDEVRLLSRDVDKYLAAIGKDPVAGVKFSEYTSRFNALNARRDEYTVRLGQPLPASADALSQVRATILSMRSRIETRTKRR